MTDIADDLILTSDMLKTHNGTLSIYNPATGGHATIRIKTQKATAKFAPGERIVSLLTGSDNENDFTGFGFLKPCGSIVLWKKCRTKKFEDYAWILQNIDAFRAERGLKFMLSGTCRICNRKLTHPESVSSGIGPECRKKM